MQRSVSSRPRSTKSSRDLVGLGLFTLGHWRHGSFRERYDRRLDTFTTCRRRAGVTGGEHHRQSGRNRLARLASSPPVLAFGIADIVSMPRTFGSLISQIEAWGHGAIRRLALIGWRKWTRRPARNAQGRSQLHDGRPIRGDAVEMLSRTCRTYAAAPIAPRRRISSAQRVTGGANQNRPPGELF
jgi:hypothetical protein